MADIISVNQLGGMNSGISPMLQQDNMPVVLNGCNISHKLGAVLKDTGYSQVSNTVESGKSILGAYDFHQNPSTQKMFVTVDDSTSDDTQLKFYSGGSWTEVAAAETAWANKATMNVEMEGFIGYCFFVGYGSTDGFLPVASLTNTTFSTSTNVTNMPQAKYIKRYRDRLYIAHCYESATLYPYRVYFSSIPSAGAITWTVATDFVDVDYGEQIMGIGTNWDRLAIFTENSCYFYDQNSFKKVFDVGCSNHRTIQTQSVYMIWADYDGVWISTGGQPTNIAGPVIDFIRNATPRNFFATIVDEEYRLFVGTVTVDGVSYTNCELRFNIPTSTWTIREFLSDTPTIYARYNNSGKMQQYIGLSDGEVMVKGKYTDATLISSDDGNPIQATFELAPIWLNNLGREKIIREIYTFANRAQALNLKYRVLDRQLRSLTPYQNLGTLNSMINRFDINNDDSGVFIQICGQEYSTNPYFSFYGYQLEIDDQGKKL